MARPPRVGTQGEIQHGGSIEPWTLDALEHADDLEWAARRAAGDLQQQLLALAGRVRFLADGTRHRPAVAETWRDAIQVVLPAAEAAAADWASANAAGTRAEQLPDLERRLRAALAALEKGLGGQD